MTADVRFLSLDELQELSRRASFAEAASGGGAATMEMRPIDGPLSALSRAWTRHPSLARIAVLAREELVEREAPPESARRYYPPERQTAWIQHCKTKARGVKVSGWTLLLIEGETDSGELTPGQIWGVADGRGDLVFGRSLPMGAVMAASAGMEGAFAAWEKREISGATPEAALDAAPKSRL